MRIFFWSLLVLAFPVHSCAAEPRVLIDGCVLEQVAREPRIVTPVGLSCDSEGQLLVVESHTHQRPDGYEGPQTDRIRVLADSDGDGDFDRWSTFADGFTHAMNVLARPDGGVYVVTRSAVHLLRDEDGDGSADANEKLIQLETDEDYPHNALSGLALVGEKLYVGLGENMGAAYRLVGSDGTAFEDAGGAGAVFVCNPDGTDLRRYATGFWNPFSLCSAGGRLLTVDNDPDASPPCRLIDVVERGDYGFRFEYGRSGVHPLHSWNGELPGTLPMVCGTGEAPTAVVFHRGYLWVTSWGDHRIERYELSAADDGALKAEMAIVVQGEADFRPTGMTVGADDALYFGDWVDRSYPVHGKGRIWRLTLPEGMQVQMPRRSLVKQAPTELSRLEALRWERSLSSGERTEVLRDALRSEDTDVRLLAARWAAEVRETSLAADIERLLNDSVPSERYYLAVLGAIDWLRGEPTQRHSGIADGLLARELRNGRRNDQVKALALRMMSPDYKYLTMDRFHSFLNSPNEQLRLEAVRSLGRSKHPDRFDMLEQIVRNKDLSDGFRVEAIVGLSAAWQKYRTLFESLADSENSALSKEAQRILQLAGQRLPPVEEVPPAIDLKSWQELLEERGDSASGRRLFFGHVGPQCSACHQYEGRGGGIGPDLTYLARQSSREKIIESILNPSAEVAPHYQPTILRTFDGKSYVGLRLPKGGDDGWEAYADTSGERFELPSDSIEIRQPTNTSLMPAGLEKSLTLQDVRDLVAFLTESDCKD